MYITFRSLTRSGRRLTLPAVVLINSSSQRHTFRTDCRGVVCGLLALLSPPLRKIIAENRSAVHLVNHREGAGPLERGGCTLVRKKVLSHHEIEVGFGCQAQFVLSPCQTMCIRQEESRYSLCSRPSLTKPGNQQWPPSSRTPPTPHQA